ncbi:MAG: hypothetical protein AABY95_10235 [Pseudomonadota bacterium]
MNFETVVEEVKGGFELVSSRAQGAAEASFKTLVKANDVVVGGVQGLVKTHTEAGKALLDAGLSSFDKAKTDGLMAVVANPIVYLPAGKDTLVDAFSDTVDTFTKTGEKLVKVIVTGYETIANEIAGIKPVKKKAKKAVKAA